ncbi:MAG: 23S rRNA (adenine(2503)-C(2))-methyltransferase RlmN [Actinomycetes bacterium]
MRSAYDLELEDLSELLPEEPTYRARQVFDGLHGGLRRIDEMTEIPAALRGRLAEILPAGLTVVSERSADDGGTVKWALELDDGALIETVLMHYERRSTVCVSTQAGCAMACSFCATGQAGFTRHLTTGEIVEQVVIAARAAAPRRVSNIVFMGMGEPLANWKNLAPALHRLNGPLGLGARRLTVSTVGHVPGIRNLTAEPLAVNLAVSLHSADDRRRDALIPLNRTYPLGVLAEVLADYVETTHRRLSFEWALIDGVNDTDRDLDELAAYARPLAAHVNLIPLNPTPGYLVRGSTPQRVAEFAAGLAHRQVTATVRMTRGQEIDAACGQLAGRTKVELRTKEETDVGP